MRRWAGQRAALGCCGAALARLDRVTAAPSNATDRPRYRRLRAQDYATIVGQHLAGVSKRRIAAGLEVDESTVRRALTRPACLDPIQRLQRRQNMGKLASSVLNASSETEGLVRLQSPDGTTCAWHEQSELDALLQDGWLPA